MACRVRYLNSSGIHLREIPGIQALASAFPEQWLFYASLQCFPPRSFPIEIDALVVMDDGVLVLELKDYNGKLKSNGDQWVLNDRPRGRSAVDMVSEKARKVKGVLGSTVPGFSKFPVDARVVLTGTADKSELNDSEKSYVWSLQEATTVADAADKRRLLGRRTLHARKAFSFEPDFEGITRNARRWRAAEGSWDGYRVIEEDVVVHPDRIWREHRAERARDPRFKALLRMWAFDRLPPGMNSPDHRQRIADREMRAIGLLYDLGSRLVKDGGILLPTGEDKDEVLTQHFELRMLPRDWLTLDRFVERSRTDITDQDRLMVSASLLNVVAELHARGIAHRDIGPRCVWLGDPTKVALSGLMTCQIPGEESVSDWFSVLRGHSAPVPEDAGSAKPGSAKQRDVFALGRMIRRILADAGFQNVKDAPDPELPKEFGELLPCLTRATAVDPASRYESAQTMADDFSDVMERLGGKQVDQSILDRAETPDVPYVKYPQHEPIETAPRVHLYLHRTGAGELYVVKLWPGMRRGTSVAADLAMIRMFETAGRLGASPVSGLPEMIESGISPVGPFVVYRHKAGETLDAKASFAADAAVDLAEKLLHAVNGLHAMDFHHGDVAPKNVLVDNDGGVTLLDLFDMSPVGDGRVRTPDYCPEGWERLTEKQIDRHAALVICASLLGAAADERLANAREAIAKELERPTIETLEPALIALKAAFATLHEPPAPRFLLVAPAFVPGEFKSDDGTFFLRVQRPGRGRLQYKIAGVDQELTFETEPGKRPIHWFTAVSYNSLMHASMRGAAVRYAIDLGRGPESGFDGLLEFLQRTCELPIEEDPTTAAPPAIVSPEPLLLDVPRYWRGLIELEESFQPEIEILRELGTRGGMAAYAYERIGGDFDFDAESQVEVRLYGRKVGEIDVNQTDERALVLRHADRLLRTGDRVTLVDRRSRASLDRRRKAVERILDGEAALPSLPAYFSPRSEPDTEDYATEVEEAVLDAYRLNKGQKIAFRHIVRYGPVGLLQGPPGTGKTHFIAALVHWLVTQAGAQKILIASQSHEAVNNAIEKLVDLFKGLKRRPNLLRIGSKGITQKIRPYHTTSSRDGYKVRFDNAFKHRIASLGAAVGLRKEFVADAVEIERLIGRPVDRIETLIGMANEPDGMAAEDRRRYDSSLRSAINAFVSGGHKLTGRELNFASATEELDAAYDDLVDRHEGTSPSDVAKIRGLISLSLEWSDALGTSHRNFEEFLAKTRTIVTATCVGAGQTRIRIDARAYDWVIVDEAAVHRRRTRGSNPSRKEGSVGRRPPATQADVRQARARSIGGKNAGGAEDGDLRKRFRARLCFGIRQGERAGADGAIPHGSGNL